MIERPNLDKLRGKLAEANLSQAELAKKMRMSPATLSNKMRGVSEISVLEASTIMQACNERKPGTFTDADLMAVFFPWL